MSDLTTDRMKPASNLQEAKLQLDERGFCVLEKLLSDAAHRDARAHNTPGAP